MMPSRRECMLSSLDFSSLASLSLQPAYCVARPRQSGRRRSRQPRRFPATCCFGSRSASSGASRCASATSAAVNGVMGARAGTTRPMVCTASGSTMGMARMVSVRPSVSEHRRNFDADGLGGFEVDDQFELVRGLDRQIGGVRATQDAIHITRGAAVLIHQIDSVDRES
jgi:hypothetical protein